MSDSPSTDAQLYRDACALAASLAAGRPDLLTIPITEVLRRLNPCRHSVDFASIIWFGELIPFTANQSHAVRLLWAAWQDGTRDVRQETLMEAAGSAARKLADVFRSHTAWGRVIGSASKGTYRLLLPGEVTSTGNPP